MDKIKNILTTLGFSDKETEIYLSLLELGKASYTQLAKTTGLKRTSLYSMIAPLQERGIITYDAEERKLIPQTPDELFSLLQSKVLQFHRFIPQLKELTDKDRAFSRLKIYSGSENMKRMFRVIRNSGYLNNRNNKRITLHKTPFVF